MFTGIIEEIGHVAEAKQGSRSMVLNIQAELIMKDIVLGDSISINGICLTVTGFNDKTFAVDVMPETMKATNLRFLKKGSPVNLERAMAANGRFGGHFVSGHVDGTGIIAKKKAEENAVYYTIQTSEFITETLMLKGSIAVDGISLTIFGLKDGFVTVSLIPHTLQETVLGSKGEGDTVNIECDMVGKYLYKFAEGGKKKPLNADFFREHGFI
ncbi:riboflavin synthase [Metabacillus sp. GX 13764]|uniref:riboflavin synthase n=1 Tax=Metabacillus kandeliae TaxID=2900151 RepID=UPI001E291A04|nr:riboflavin synthase [Metabacillus kandeliae]MCD7033305.1 riboflavin synthase [Metabacillus kandeliae]